MHPTSWHRTFLFFFESVLKQAAKDAGDSTEFELPYWDCSAQPVMSRRFHTREGPSGQPNSLLHPRLNPDLSNLFLARAPSG
ncbi:tyrosinase family protein [Methylocystis rosea]|uniref:tyrosinase family protein n=1 Tax=Methylocystis rosea TaxID=173366 RepID=UPI003CC91110